MIFICSKSESLPLCIIAASVRMQRRSLSDPAGSLRERRAGSCGLGRKPAGQSRRTDGGHPGYGTPSRPGPGSRFKLQPASERRPGPGRRRPVGVSSTTGDSDGSRRMCMSAKNSTRTSMHSSSSGRFQVLTPGRHCIGNNFGVQYSRFRCAELYSAFQVSSLPRIDQFRRTTAFPRCGTVCIPLFALDKKNLRLPAGPQ